jgi:hypothetical protein
MSLLGTGVLANWGGVVAAAEADYNAWHSLEHMPERIAVPGFRRGRRAIAIPGTPDHLKYFMMYEVDEPAVLVSAPYLARLNDPTPWTRRILSQYVAPCRTICEVLASEGHGTGGYLATVQFAPSSLDPACEAAVGLVKRALALPGVLGAHVLRGDPAFGQQPTAEKKFRESRGDPDRTVSLALLIDGLDLDTTGKALEHALDLAQRTIDGERIATLYRTQHVIVRDDVSGRR